MYRLKIMSSFGSSSNKLEYLKFATHNLNDILNDKNGCQCVFCFKKPKITSETLLCDESTVLCPLCGIDAVVPSSKIPNFKTLKRWRQEGFGF